MIGDNLCSDCPPNEQIAALRHFLLAGDLSESCENIIDEDDTNISFIQVCESFLDQRNIIDYERDTV